MHSGYTTRRLCDDIKRLIDQLYGRAAGNGTESVDAHKSLAKTFTESWRELRKAIRSSASGSCEVSNDAGFDCTYFY